MLGYIGIKSHFGAEYLDSSLYFINNTQALVLAHELRWKIMQILYKNQPIYAKQLAEDLDLRKGIAELAIEPLPFQDYSCNDYTIGFRIYVGSVCSNFELDENKILSMFDEVVCVC